MTCFSISSESWQSEPWHRCSATHFWHPRVQICITFEKRIAVAAALLYTRTVETSGGYQITGMTVILGWLLQWKQLSSALLLSIPCKVACMWLFWSLQCYKCGYPPLNAVCGTAPTMSAECFTSTNVNIDLTTFTNIYQASQVMTKG